MKTENLKYCGSCSFCCYALDVPELNKKAGENCKHLTDDGCSIYNDRPDPCVGFNCAWKYDIIKDKKHLLRPDKIGVMIVPKAEVEGHSPAVQLISKYKLSFENVIVKEMIKNLVNHGFFVVKTVAGEDQSELVHLRRKS